MSASCSRRGSHKRSLDLAIMLLAHIILSPIFVLLWTVIPLLIWLEDRETVFYRQVRPGRNGRLFTVLKFRTMVVGADQIGPAWTIEKDTRITRIGKLLRRTALDELPSLLSVWQGDMSLVGPRALPIREQELMEDEIPDFACRLKVRPGLTGMAQVYDLEDEAHRKLQYDLEYIQNMSLALDLKLLILSVRNTLLGKWDIRTGKQTADQ